MDLEQRIEKVLESAFDYSDAIKRINRSEDEVSELRDLVRNDEKIPPCVTDKHVSCVFTEVIWMCVKTEGGLVDRLSKKTFAWIFKKNFVQLG